jgi:hypothetical protein
MPSGCDDCDSKQKAMTPAQCAAACASIIALPSMGATVDIPAVKTIPHFTPPHASGHSDPPDPYPPRSVVLI